MPCLCTIRTLQLFIRGVSQINILTPQISRNSNPLQIVAARNLTSTLPNFERPKLTALPISEASTDNIRLTTSQSNVSESAENSKIWFEGDTGEDRNHKTKTDVTNAVADLSPESIDAIIAESEFNSEPLLSHYNTEKDVSPSRPAQQQPSRWSRVGKAESRGRASRSRLREKSGRKETEESERRSKSTAQDWEPKKQENFKTDDGWKPPPRESWQVYKEVLKKKFPEGWNPPKRLSPDALAGIRALHAQEPDLYTTAALAASFQVSPEMIRRILKSKWIPSINEAMDRERRWLNRGKSIYQVHADKGQKPPKMWREMGIGNGKPEWLKRNQALAARPVPALITTSRRRDEKYGLVGGKKPQSSSGNLGDTIL
jgi:hypothetical protein